LHTRLPENFDRPFSSDNFLNFWSRWHITLSEWLKTYVHNPLLLNLMRRYPSPALQTCWGVLAVFVTFFLIGVWHGQTLVFVFFGVLQGLGVRCK
jgi:alginate O-acetyltransferase complex protein AlgI